MERDRRAPERRVCMGVHRIEVQLATVKLGGEIRVGHGRGRNESRCRKLRAATMKTEMRDTHVRCYIEKREDRGVS